MNDKYIFELDNTSDACILNIKNKQTNILECYYKLEDYTRIEDVRFYDESCFYLLTDDSELYVGELGHNGLEKLQSSPGILTPGYYFEKEDKKLYLAFEIEKEEKSIFQCWDLLEKKCSQEIELPANIDFGNLQRRSDGSFLFYQNSKRDLNHGFYCLDIKTEQITYHALEDKPQGIRLNYSYNSFFPHNKDIAVLPICYECPNSTDEKNNTLYNYQLEFINLNDFSSTKKTVRKFRVEDIYMEDYEGEKGLKRLQKEFEIFADENKDFKDADYKKEFVEKYLDVLNEIIIYDDEDELWLKWDESLTFSKLDLEGNNISPLYHLKDESGLNIGFFNKTTKAKQEEKELIKNTLKAPEKAIEEDGKAILIIEAPKPKEIIMPESYHSMAKKDGINIIQVADLYAKGKSEALSILVQKMKEDMDALRDGNKLIFQFTDKKGMSQSLLELVDSTIYIDENAELIKEFIEIFSKYEHSKELEDKEGRAVFTDIASYLIEDQDFKYLKTLSSYFNAIDATKSEHLIEEVLPPLGFIYEGVEEYEEFISSIPKEFIIEEE